MLCSIYLEVYVSDPFHDSVTSPNNGVTVVVLAVCPSNLKSLRKHNAEITASECLQSRGKAGEGDALL